MEIRQFDISKKKWSVGDFSARVIADDVSYVNETNKDEYKDEVNFFGGYLVCDNIRSEEDARLIAAAPELLNALQRLVSTQEEKMIDGDWEGYKEEWENAKKAIDKALGK